MKNDPAVPLTLEVAFTLAIQYMACLRFAADVGNKPAWTGIARCLQECCLSVSHAEAVVKTFDEEFPTLKAIRDVAFNLRPKFAPPEPSQKEKWEAEYGPPDSSFYEELQREWATSGYKPGQEQEQMWAAIRKKLLNPNFAKVPWGQIYSVKRELGWQLMAFEKEQADQWDLMHPKSKPPAAAGPIRQEHIDAELAKRAVNGPREVLIKLPAPEPDPVAATLKEIDDGYYDDADDSKDD